MSGALVIPTAFTPCETESRRLEKLHKASKFKSIPAILFFPRFFPSRIIIFLVAQQNLLGFAIRPQKLKKKKELILFFSKLISFRVEA